ncbi:MAG TPA: DAK2 domain-containing protein [Acidimicrobiales bacterium]|nr:DAK2 domain-containing protein [Acidimicrobiales bacterium]
MTGDTLDARGLADALVAFGGALQTHKDSINRLNVYPVPDGDTGTNMSLTVEAAIAELQETLDSDPSERTVTEMAAACKAVSHGALMGARGNSGVILCQILRGMCGTFAGAEAIAGGTLAAGLAEASDAARAGVLKPVEGTILTVMTAAAEAAGEAVAGNPGSDVGEVAGTARRAAVETLARTREMLPVLEKAGVVDAGGAGLVLLFDALVHVVTGEAMPEELPIPADVMETIRLHGASEIMHGDAFYEAMAAADDADADGIAGLRYEVMYFLEAPDSSIPAFKEVWAGIGDSIVVVGGDGLWNCHIHTDDIGASIEAAIDAGRPREIRVTDLLEQVEEEQWVRSAAAGDAGEAEGSDAGAVPRTAVVAVASGEGIRRIFHSLGVRRVVAGGQSMNPSTAQILEIVDAVRSDEVVVLPNNKNIFPVAAQVCALSDKRVRVVETASIQEGFAALLEYDPEEGADVNAEVMAEAASRVVAGEVTRAVRDSESPAGPIEAGDWMGLTGGQIVTVAKSTSDATCDLLDKLVSPVHEIVTLIEGAGATAADTRRITEWLRANRPSATFELHQGGQPLYPYLISIE